MRKGQEEIIQMTKDLKIVNERYKRFLIREGLKLEKLAKEQLDRDFANFPTRIDGVFFGGDECIKAKYYKSPKWKEGYINIFFMLESIKDEDFDEEYEDCCEHLCISDLARIDELYANYSVSFEDKCDTFIKYMECLQKIIDKKFFDDDIIKEHKEEQLKITIKGE